MTNIRFLHYPVSNLSKQEIISELIQQANNQDVSFITVMNANKMYLYDHNLTCRKSIDESLLILPENAINIGMKFLGTPLKEWDVGGFEIAKEILSNTILKTFLFGAREDILDILTSNSDYSKNIVGTQNGYYKDDELDKIALKINNTNADIILLGLGSPKQEILMQSLKLILKKGILIGVGGTFDVLAGMKKEAPKWTKRGLEWLYRAIQDPKKFKRYLNVNSYYILSVLKYKLKNLRFF